VITASIAQPIIRRWVATDVTTNPKIQRQVQEFFKEHRVKSVAISEGNMGCPHEEGEDFPRERTVPSARSGRGSRGATGGTEMAGLTNLFADITIPVHQRQRVEWTDPIRLVILPGIYSRE
jgi:hypothetical protein